MPRSLTTRIGHPHGPAPPRPGDPEVGLQPGAGAAADRLGVLVKGDPLWRRLVGSVPIRTAESEQVPSDSGSNVGGQLLRA